MRGAFGNPVGFGLDVDRRPRRSSRLVNDARAAFQTSTPTRRGRIGVAHRLMLIMVWLTLAISGIVFAEPAPVDVLVCGLILLLPTMGLVTITPSLVTFLGLWLVAAALGFVAAGFSPELRPAIVFTAVSLYLYLAAFIFAGFVAKRPDAHTHLIFSGWTAAAVVAALAGLAGYFSLFPGAYEMFTKFGRASGTFKDPNVFGPFLVAPMLYMLHLVLSRPLRYAVIPLSIAGLLMLAVLLSFSRGAWINLAGALLTFAYLSFVTAPTPGQRARLVTLLGAGLMVLIIVIMAAAQTERVSELLSERASLTQSYDVGPDGRFGGQSKAVDLILDNPLGIGALTFGTVHHHEGVHNVYLNMALNAGWVGGVLFAIMTLLTIGLGLRHLLRSTATRPLFAILFSVFLAHAVEGFVIDTDHWRHLYLIMGMMWGLMAADHLGAETTADRGASASGAVPIALAYGATSAPKRRARLLG